MPPDPTRAAVSLHSARKVAAPGSIEPPQATWSNCLVVGDDIVMSGVTARHADGRPIGGDDMYAQTQAVLARIGAMVEAAGGGRGSIYKLVIYVTDVSRKDEVNRARAEFFKPLYPCSTLVEVKGFAFPGLIVEIDAFARIGLDLHAGQA